MAEVVEAIERRCTNLGITDGCCGFRELISWVKSYMITGEVLPSAFYTVLSKVSNNEENRMDILETCINPIFG